MSLQSNPARNLAQDDNALVRRVIEGDRHAFECLVRRYNRRLYRVKREAFGELRTFLEVFWDNSLSSLKRQVEADKGKRRG